MTDLRYPIGPFTDHARDRTTAAEQAGLMDEMAAAPARLRAAVAGLDDAQLDTPYRENGWTVRQVVHQHYAWHGKHQVVSRDRQPRQRLCAVSVGTHGGRTRDQAVRRKRMGAPAGRDDRAGGGVAGSAGCAP